MRGLLAAARAELRELETVGVVPTVLLGDVVALLALGAGERDLRANLRALLGHYCHFLQVISSLPSELIDLRFSVTRAGLEPATQRL